MKKRDDGTAGARCGSGELVRVLGMWRTLSSSCLAVSGRGGGCQEQGALGPPPPPPLPALVLEMAARPVFASIENIGLPGPARAALEHAQETLPATTAFPPTADEVTKARRVASEYHHVAEVYKSVSRECRAC